METQKAFSFTPDDLSEARIRELLDQVDRALSDGFKLIILSVLNGSLTNKIAVSRLFLHCQQIIRRKGGRVYVIEHREQENSEYQNICSFMHIPVYFAGHNYSESMDDISILTHT